MGPRLACIILYSLISIASSRGQEEVITWHPDILLDWADFQGTPDKNSIVAATTASGISYQFSAHERDGYYEVEYEVETSFYPMQSWYRPHMCDDLVLSHEQLHFDISEVFARKMRNKIDSTRFTENVKREVRDIYKEIIRELAEFQDRYDRETDFSRNREAQLRWNRQIKELLNR